MLKYFAKKLYLILPLLLISEVAIAGFFDPPAQDKSLNLLGYIFGSNVSYFTGDTPSPVLAQMFEIFNGIIVGVGTAIVGYVGTISVINTAQEGTVMGKKWSSIWTPMRSIFGLLLMVPTTGSGYSLIQNTVIWLVVQGVGAAGSVWNVVMDNLAEGVSVVAENKTTDLSSVETATKATADSVLHSLVCQKVFQKIGADNAYLDEPLNGVPVPADQFLTTFGTQTSLFTEGGVSGSSSISLGNQIGTYDDISVNGTLYVGIPGSSEVFQSVCGKYDISGTASVNDWPNKDAQDNLTYRDVIAMAQKIYDTKELALRNMFDALEPLAQAIVDNEIGPRTDPVGGQLRPDNINMSGYRTNAVDSYVSTISQLIIPGDEMGDSVRAAAELGKATGWIDAGAFYFTMHRTIEKKLFPSAKIVPAGANIVTFDNYETMTAGLNEYLSTFEQAYLLTRLYDVKIYIDSDAANRSPIQELQGLPDGMSITKVLNPMNTFAEVALKTLTSLMATTDGDPLIAHANFGSFLMFGAEVAWLYTLAALVLTAGISAVCSATNPGFQMVNVFVIFITGLIVSLLGILWTTGASLAVYSPLIPFMIFSFGAIGWMIQVIEAIVASPIIALGLVLPSQDEIGKIQNGLLILLNVFLRPTLMVFGFVVAAKLYAAAVNFIKFGLEGTFSTMPVDTTLFSWIPMICMYVLIVVAITNKCFALIYILPDKILRWIGGQAESVGQEQTQMMQEVKQGTEKASEMASAPGKAASDKAMAAESKIANEGASKTKIGAKIKDFFS